MQVELGAAAGRGRPDVHHHWVVAHAQPPCCGKVWERHLCSMRNVWFQDLHVWLCVDAGVAVCTAGGHASGDAYSSVLNSGSCRLFNELVRGRGEAVVVREVAEQLPCQPAQVAHLQPEARERLCNRGSGCNVCNGISAAPLDNECSPLTAVAGSRRQPNPVHF